METPNEAEPPDQRMITALIVSAGQFEDAVRGGYNLMAAVAARKIVRSFKRFFPDAVAIERSSGTERSAEASFTISLSVPVSVPDPNYMEIVRTAVKEFKEAIRARDAAGALVALRPTGILGGVPSPAEELQQLEIEAARKSGNRRLPFLPQMAKLALWVGDADKAERYASEALGLILPPQVDPFDTSAEAIHDANMVAGLVALRRGDLERAKQSLLASARTRGSRELRMIGPNLTLANELLKKGEREVVVEYLQGCRSFWSTGQKLLEKWIEQIRSGENPEFDPLLLSS